MLKHCPDIDVELVRLMHSVAAWYSGLSRFDMLVAQGLLQHCRPFTGSVMATVPLTLAANLNVGVIRV